MKTAQPWAQSDSAPHLVFRDHLGVIDMSNPVASFIHPDDAAATIKAFDLLHRNLAAWEDEEESVQEEHHELIKELRTFLEEK